MFRCVALENLAKSSDEDVRRQAEGALWVVQKKEKEKTGKNKAQTSKNKHVLEAPQEAERPTAGCRCFFYFSLPLHIKFAVKLHLCCCLVALLAYKISH